MLIPSPGRLQADPPPERAALEAEETLDPRDWEAFDPHKWGYFPIEVGCILVRDAAAHRATFAATADYLARLEGGIAARTERFADYGPELSRGFKALKVWMGMKAYGADLLGRLIRQNVEQARFLAERVARSEELELLAPASLNIVCFRYRGRSEAGDLDALNRALLVDEVRRRGHALAGRVEGQGRIETE